MYCAVHACVCARHANTGGPITLGSWGGLVNCQDNYVEFHRT